MRSREAIDVESAYTIWAQDYDTCANPTRDLDATVVREALLRRDDRSIVELGCGTGKNTAWLAETARDLIALDTSEAMLERARARVRARNVRFVRHDLRARWPIDDASVDLVVGNLVLEHIRDLGPIFREAARVARGGGELFVSELHPFRQLLGSGAKISGDDRRRVEAYVHDVSDYVNGALEVGFAVCEIGEWRDRDIAADDAPAIPRLLTIRFSRTTS